MPDKRRAQLVDYHRGEIFSHALELDFTRHVMENDDAAKHIIAA
jgi:hypothetical protein